MVSTSLDTSVQQFLALFLESSIHLLKQNQTYTIQAYETTTDGF